MKYEKEINWLRDKGYTGNRFTSDAYDDFTIGVFAKRLHEYASEVNGDETSHDKALHKHDVIKSCEKCKNHRQCPNIPFPTKEEIETCPYFEHVL